MLRAAPSAPKKAIVQKSPPSKSELLRVLRAAPSAPKKLSQKIHHPQKIRVLRVAPSTPKIPTLKKSECSELLRVLPKKLSPQKNPHPKPPHPLPKPSTNSALQRLTITSTKPHKSPHHFVIAPRPTTHYLCFQKSQISHVHKHNAFQFRLRNRNISSS